MTDPTSFFDDIRAAFRVEAEAAFEAVLAAQLPGILRRATLPPYLSRKQLCELTGWSPRKVDYLRTQRRIPFVRRGRSVLFPTSEVEAYLDAGRVAARAEAR